MLSKGASWLGRLTTVELLLVDELSCWSVRVSLVVAGQGEKKEGESGGLVRVRPGHHVPIPQVAETLHPERLDTESSCTRKCNDLSSGAGSLEYWFRQKGRKR